MKRLLNCKAILALAICLTMFAGLTMTAFAVPNPYCDFCNIPMGNTKNEAVYCGRCAKTQSAEKYVCYLNSSHVKYYCTAHQGWM